MSNYSTELNDEQKKELFKDASEVTLLEVTRDEYVEKTNESARWRSKIGPFVMFGTVNNVDKAVTRYARTWADVVTHLHPRFIRNSQARAPKTSTVTYTPQFHRAGDYPTEEEEGSSTA
jgi:hypothetical protein